MIVLNSNLEAARKNISLAYRLVRDRWPYSYQVAFWNDDRRLTTWNKSRDTGMSEAASFRGFHDAWSNRPGTSRETMLMSVSRRQVQHLREYVEEYHMALSITPIVNNKEFIRYDNGNCLIFLPQSPSAVRTYHGNVLMDEAAHFTWGRKIKQAAIPFIGRGYRLTMVSTPFGEDELFFPTWNNPMFHQNKIHYTECPDLMAIDPEYKIPRWQVIKESLDEDSWFQEYCNEFLDESIAFIPSSLILDCTDAEMDFYTATITAHTSEDEFKDIFCRVGDFSPTRAGQDYGQKIDASQVLFVKRDHHAVDRNQIIITMRNVPYSTQETIAKRLASLCPDGYFVDATSAGEGIRSHLINSTGKDTGIQFTAKNKDILARDLKKALEDKKLILPSYMPLQRQIHSIKRTRGATSNVYKYDTDRSEGHHADMFWALSLAISDNIKPNELSFSAWTA